MLTWQRVPEGIAGLRLRMGLRLRIGLRLEMGLRLRRGAGFWAGPSSA
jgi:hypothetical protein